MARGKGSKPVDRKPSVFSYARSGAAHSRQLAPPSEAAIVELAEKHSYSDSSQLYLSLFDIWIWLQADREAGPKPKRSELIKSLDEIKVLSTRLAEVIDCLGTQERSAILDATKPDLIDFGGLQDQLLRLSFGSDVGVKFLKPARRGAPGYKGLVWLQCSLFALNVAEFGSSASRITKADGYQGRFFSFAKDVCNLFGLDLDDATLGRSIEKGIVAYDKRHARVNPDK